MAASSTHSKDSAVQRKQDSSAASKSAPSAAVQMVQGKSYEEASSLLSPSTGALSPVQRKGGEDTSAVHEHAARGASGSGGSLPYGDQIQAAFGRHDVGGIKAHTGSEAKAATSAMGAQAYASGNNVVLGGGTDLHTVAHEAAHLVQQQSSLGLSGGVGQVGDRHEQHADAVADAVVSGRSAEGLLDKYAPQQTSTAGIGGATQMKAIQLKATPQEEKQIETGVVDSMKLANQNTYPRYYKPDTDPKAWSQGLAPAAYWKRTGFYQFELLPGKSASAALDELFKGPTILECQSTAIAVHLRAVRETIGQAKFDEKYGAAGKTNQDFVVGISTRTKKSSVDALTDAKFIDRKDLKVGDRAYFFNHPKYIVRHPSGFWSGEHVVYQGGGMWSGFGAAGKSENAMKQKLMSQYNKAPAGYSVKARDAHYKGVKDALTAGGYSAAAQGRAKAALDSYYNSAPASVALKDIPGLDGAGRIKAAMAQERQKLGLKESLVFATLEETATKRGAPKAQLPTIKAQVKAHFDAIRVRITAQEAKGAAHAGKVFVRRLNADKVTDLKK